MSSWAGIEGIALVSGGAGDPVLLAGTVNPMTGVPAPEGSIYMMFVATAGRTFWKYGSDDSDWLQMGGPTDVVDSVPVATVNLVADAAILNVTGLDGDADETYEIWAHLLYDNGLRDGYVMFNGDSGANYNYALADNTGVFRLTGQTAIRIWNMTGAQTNNYFDGVFAVRAVRTINGVTKNRTMMGWGGRYNNANASLQRGMDGRYLSDAANLTSIQFMCQGGNMLAGSRVRVYRRKGDAGFV